jgi:hypothetical protein
LKQLSKGDGRKGAVGAGGVLLRLVMGGWRRRGDKGVELEAGPSSSPLDMSAEMDSV